MQIGYGKMSGCAVAAMSAVAEHHQAGTALNSADIATLRNLSQPLVAKVMNSLSRAGYITGTRGPGGGYRLAKSPEKIRIYDIVSVFEGVESELECPFGPGYCGHHAPCPMHETLANSQSHYIGELKRCHLGLFVKPPSE
jgi:Rrf2 family transcriptional regulator, iron-sulfur cluster assembly transcription factor